MFVVVVKAVQAKCLVTVQPSVGLQTVPPTADLDFWAATVTALMFYFQPFVKLIVSLILLHQLGPNLLYILIRVWVLCTPNAGRKSVWHIFGIKNSKKQ